jgi:15-cis-phytoene synthase
MSKAQLKQHGKTFHFASRFLSSRDLEAASVLYGLCREIDDIADLNRDGSHAHQLLSELITALKHRDRSHPMVCRALGIEPAIDLEVLVELIEGVMTDTGTVRITSESELLRYCYQVAGTVGLLMCDIFQVHDMRARHHAVDLGIAMQLTNIARDVIEDAKSDRRYLPSDHIGNIEPSTMLAPSHAQAAVIQDGVAKLLVEAELRYESGLSGLPFLPPRARMTILVAAMVYREIGIVIADRNFDVWQPRAYTSQSRKCITAARSMLTFAFDRRIHRYRGPHDARLHIGLPNRPGVHLAI